MTDTQHQHKLRLIHYYYAKKALTYLLLRLFIFCMLIINQHYHEEKSY
jgi:hypothetical protein